jgi:hypothetical protein
LILDANNDVILMLCSFTNDEIVHSLEWHRTGNKILFKQRYSEKENKENETHSNRNLKRQEIKKISLNNI